MGHSNIPAISGSDACSIFSNYVFLSFAMPCNIFLIVLHNVLDKNESRKLRKHQER